jgi:uncharacterized protein (DUF2345 family)
MSTTIVQVEMTDLDVTVTVGVHKDPGGEFVEGEAAPRPPVAPTTAGPHRYTVHVPHDDAAMLSMGRGCPDRIKDTGITARTNSHIHFETRETAKTAVSLGGPTQDVILTSYDSTVLKQSQGFAMVTHDQSWMESHKKFHITSTEEDVVARAMEGRIVLQADHGDVDVTAHHSVNLISKAVNITSSAEPQLALVNYEGAWSHEVAEEHHKLNWTHGLEIAALGSVALDLGVEAVHFYSAMKHWKKESPSPYLKPAMTAAHWTATAVRFALTTQHLVHAMGDHHAPGTVKIGSESDFGVIAGATATMFGKTAATVGSLMFSTIVAPLCTLEGVLFSGMSGKHSAVLGLMGAEIAAPLGSVAIEGKKEVEIGCHGEIAIAGHREVFMRSEHAGAFVHGVEKASLASGHGAGFGAVATAHYINMGKMVDTGNLPSAGVHDDCSLKMNEEGILLFHNAAGFEISDNTVKMTTAGAEGELIINGSEIRVEGQRVLLA